jgi:hypothetical protein
MERAKGIGLHDFASLRVECREGLVKQQYLWIDSERAGNIHTLAHSARKLVRIMVLKATQAGEIDEVLGGMQCLRFRNASERQTVGDVFDDGFPGQKCVLLGLAEISVRTSAKARGDRKDNIMRKLSPQRLALLEPDISAF